jgi:hypothetical protein
MVKATIEQIKERIENSDSIEQENKRELVDLLVSLQAEIDRLSNIDADHAESIAGFARTSTHEALRKEKKPDLYKLSLEGLQASVHGFENSHPKLVEIVNSICVSLSNLGI